MLHAGQTRVQQRGQCTEQTLLHQECISAQIFNCVPDSCTSAAQRAASEQPMHKEANAPASSLLDAMPCQGQNHPCGNNGGHATAGMHKKSYTLLSRDHGHRTMRDSGTPQDSQRVYTVGVNAAQMPPANCLKSCTNDMRNDIQGTCVHRKEGAKLSCL